MYLIDPGSCLSLRIGSAFFAVIMTIGAAAMAKEPDGAGLQVKLSSILEECFLDERALSRVGDEAFVKLAFRVGPNGTPEGDPELIEPDRADRDERRLLRLGTEAITDCLRIAPGSQHLSILATFRKSNVEVEITEVSQVEPATEGEMKTTEGKNTVAATPEPSAKVVSEEPVESLNLDLMPLLERGLSGQIDQPGVTSYSVVIQRRAAGITISYPELNCSGILEPAGDQGEVRFFIERVSSGVGCVDGGWIELAPVGAGFVSFRWARGKGEDWIATATLQESSVQVSTQQDTDQQNTEHPASPAVEAEPTFVPLVGDPKELEAEMRLSRDDRREIQLRLKIAGHNPRGIDGVFGPATRAAIESWQLKNGLAQTGYLDRNQRKLLNAQTAETYAEEAKRLRTRRRGRYIDSRGCLREANGRAVPNYKRGCR